MKKNKKYILTGIVVLLLVACTIGFIFYLKIFSPNVAKEKAYLYIHTNADFKQVMQTIQQENLLKSTTSFEWLANRKGYTNNVKAGKYLLKAGMNNNQIINMLRSGNQEAVNLVFNNIRTNEQLAGKLAKQIETDSTTLIRQFNNPDFLSTYKTTPEELRLLFIPNTYKIWWNISAEELMSRMQKEYEKFWNDDRNAKAYTAGLNRKEIAIIASIVEEETNQKAEKPTVASVYVNRLRKAMLLQADPTVKYAVGDFTIKRILNKHLSTDSPYNTYKYAGLPPGPICIPSISSIDAVLENKKTDYLYFCAKEDFSGFHNFAKTMDEHLTNARKYQKALNQRKIF
ncbi:MAG: endolytic transglycosylase MltG [Bacteroidetes bacterium]|nr:endolytic transglycosylase MltG [Bacteroidota bacterium]